MRAAKNACGAKNERRCAATSPVEVRLAAGAADRGSLFSGFTALPNVLSMISTTSMIFATAAAALAMVGHAATEARPLPGESAA